MKPTQQEKALQRARKEFGGTSSTEDHINYKRISCKLDGRYVSEIGDTWDEVFDKLTARQNVVLVLPASRGILRTA